MHKDKAFLIEYRLLAYLEVFIFYETMFVISDYVSKTSCRQECTTSLNCPRKHICKSVGCNRQCVPLGGVLPVDTISPIGGILPIGGIDGGLTGCIDQCQSSLECGRRGVCVREGK